MSYTYPDRKSDLILQVTQCFILAAANAVFYALALYAARRHKMFLKRNKNNDNKTEGRKCYIVLVEIMFLRLLNESFFKLCACHANTVLGEHVIYIRDKT